MGLPLSTRKRVAAHSALGLEARRVRCVSAVQEPGACIAAAFRVGGLLPLPLPAPSCPLPPFLLSAFFCSSCLTGMGSARGCSCCSAETERHCFSTSDHGTWSEREKK